MNKAFLILMLAACVSGCASHIEPPHPALERCQTPWEALGDTGALMIDAPQQYLNFKALIEALEFCNDAHNALLNAYEQEHKD